MVRAVGKRAGVLNKEYLDKFTSADQTYGGVTLGINGPVERKLMALDMVLYSETFERAARLCKLWLMPWSPVRFEGKTKKSRKPILT